MQQDESMGAFWRDVKEARQEKRRLNRTFSPAQLMAAGIEFEEKNDGAHLIVKKKEGGFVDFWPGTGLWIDRQSNKKGRGVEKLIFFIEPELQFKGKRMERLAQAGVTIQDKNNQAIMDERERCALLCEQEAQEWLKRGERDMSKALVLMAKVIREQKPLAKVGKF